MAVITIGGSAGELSGELHYEVKAGVVLLQPKNCVIHA